MTISVTLRREIRLRAKECCEYCSLPQTSFPLVSFHIEHVVARQHGGNDDAANLCLACHWCNLFKEPNLSTLVEGELTRLYNPRTDRWIEHFRCIDGEIFGLTDVGAATVKLLNMNDPDRIELRQLA